MGVTRSLQTIARENRRQVARGSSPQKRPLGKRAAIEAAAREWRAAPVRRDSRAHRRS